MRDADGMRESVGCIVSDPPITAVTDSQAHGPCPFCGRDLRTATTVETGEGMIFHAMPQCRQFEKASGPDFLRLVTAARLASS